jgi:hypothetical protein
MRGLFVCDFTDSDFFQARRWAAGSGGVINADEYIAEDT